MRGLIGRHRGAVDQFQRGERLGLRYSAAGFDAVICCCLHFSPFRHVDLCRGVNFQSPDISRQMPDKTPIFGIQPEGLKVGFA